MKKTSIKNLVLALFITLFSSYSSWLLGQTIYGNRFYLNVDKSQSIPSDSNHREESKSISTPNLTAYLETDSYQDTKKLLNTGYLSKPLYAYQTPNDSSAFENTCDEIILKEGKILKSKVIEITESDIKYKACDYLEGPIYNVKKSEVLLIKYANGKEESFNNSKLLSNKKKSLEEELLIVGIVGFGALIIFSFILYPEIYGF